MTDMSREAALEAIRRLADLHGLSETEIIQVVAKAPASSEKKSTAILGKILGFLGGIFVFAGLGVFISLYWESMNAAARVIITLGSGLAVFVIAWVGQKQGGAERFTVPLFLISAALQPVGILVAINEFSSGGDWRLAVLFTSGVMCVQQGLALRQFRSSTLVFTTLFFGLWVLWVSLDLLEVDEDFIPLMLGATTIGLCLGLEKTPFRGVTPFWYFFGSVGFFGGLFHLLRASAVELVFILAACGGVYLSIVVRSRTLLFCSTMAVLGYIGYFTGQHFLESLGWPLVLIGLGLTLIALSAGAIHVNRRYISRR